METVKQIQTEIQIKNSIESFHNSLNEVKDRISAIGHRIALNDHERKIS